MGHHDVIGVAIRENMYDAVNAVRRTHVEEEGYYHSPDDWGIVQVAPIPERHGEATLYYRSNENYVNGTRRNTAAPVISDEYVEFKTHQIKVPLAGVNKYDEHDAKCQAVREWVKTLPAGWGISRWRSVSSGHETAKTKVVATASKGKTVTRYYIADEYTTVAALKEQEWYPTQAAARAALVEMLKTSDRVEQEFEILPITRRETGEAVITARKQVVTRDAILEIDTYRIKDATKQVGWGIIMDCHF